MGFYQIRGILKGLHDRTRPDPHFEKLGRSFILQRIRGESKCVRITLTLHQTVQLESRMGFVSRYGTCVTVNVEPIEFTMPPPAV